MNSEAKTSNKLRAAKQDNAVKSTKLRRTLKSNHVDLDDCTLMINRQRPIRQRGRFKRLERVVFRYRTIYTKRCSNTKIKANWTTRSI